MHKSIIVGLSLVGSALFGACDEYEEYDGHEPAPASRVIYVAVMGSDVTGTGTAVSPLQTVAKALTMADSGDVIRLGAGHFYEAVDVVKSGTPGMPITIEGTRSKYTDELETFLHAGDVVDPDTWTPDFARGPDVYRNATLPFPPKQIVVDGYFVPRLYQTGALHLWDVLSFPLNQRIDAKTGKIALNAKSAPVKFWEVIHGVYGYRDDFAEPHVTFMRLADGRDPRNEAIVVTAADKPAISIRAAHVTVRELNIEGGEFGVEVTGSAHDVVLSDNVIANGLRRVQIDAGAHDVTVLNNTIEMRGLTITPGAWTGGTVDDGQGVDEHFYDRREYLYRYFKYVAGPSDTSDDRSIMVEGTAEQPIHDIIIEGNTLNEGLIGLEVRFATNVEVLNNHFSKYSGVGLAPRPGAQDLHFHHNVVEDANAAVRPHDLGGVGGHRVYIYNNHFYLEEKPEHRKSQAGTHVYFASVKKQVVNSEIYVLQNTMTGGSRGFSMPPLERLREPLWLSKLVIVNNLVSAALPWIGAHEFMNPSFVGAFDCNWVGGEFRRAACIPGPDPCMPESDSLTSPWMYWYNPMQVPDPLPVEYPMWFGSAPEGRGSGGDNQIVNGGYVSRAQTEDPDADLHPAVYDRGCDLSVPLQLGKQSFGPFPGMDAGYFDGERPDIGAVQFD